jgi:hypothetical protein
VAHPPDDLDQIATGAFASATISTGTGDRAARQRPDFSSSDPTGRFHRFVTDHPGSVLYLVSIMDGFTRKV